VNADGEQKDDYLDENGGNIKIHQAEFRWYHARRAGCGFGAAWYVPGQAFSVPPTPALNCVTRCAGLSRNLKP
jgi:hypothetical protein